MDHPPRDICALILRQFATPKEAFGLFRTNSYWRAAVAAHFAPGLRRWFTERYFIYAWADISDTICLTIALIIHIDTLLGAIDSDLLAKMELLSKRNVKRTAELRTLRYVKYENMKRRGELRKEWGEFERVHVHPSYKPKRAKLDPDDGG